MGEALVSVIIPVYNREKVILRAISSVLSQSYANIEVIVVDDASNDNTARVVKQVGDPRVRVISRPTNYGAAAARNVGIGVSMGQYLAFLDSDDYWLPDKIRQQVDVLNVAPDDVALVYGGAHLLVDGVKTAYLRPRHQGKLYPRLLVENVITGSASCVLLRRAVIDSIGGFDETLPARQDSDYWVRASRQYQFAFIDRPLVCINWDHASGRISADSRAIVLGRRLFMEKYIAELEGHQLISEYLQGTGRLFQLHVGDRGQARAFYLWSLRTKWTNFRSAVLWLSTWMPNPLTHHMRLLVRRLRWR